MASKWDGPETPEYMEEVENGMVHELEYRPEKKNYSRYDLKGKDKSPEKILEVTENHEYDSEYSDFSTDSISATRVGINTENGIIDVYDGEDLIDRFSLVGVLSNNGERPELIFSGFDNMDIFPKKNEEIKYGPNLAAAYEAVYHELFETPEREKEKVPLYPDDSDGSEDSLSIKTPVSARESIKRIDGFINDLKDTASGISDFEEAGEITIEGDEHYGKAKGFSAARDLKTDLNRLSSSNLMDYSTQPLNENGDEKEVDLKIEKEFLDGNNSLKDSVEGLSDFDIKKHEGRENLTEERM